MSVSVDDFSLSDLPDVAALKDSHVPGSGKRWQHRFRWQFVDNPAADATARLGWVLRSEIGKAVGCALVMPQRFRVFDSEVAVPILTDLIVAKDYRSSGLMLPHAYFQSHADALLLSTSASHVTQRIWACRGGSEVPDSGQHFSVALRPGNLIRPKLARKVGDAVAQCLSQIAGPVYYLLSRFAWRKGKSEMHAQAVCASDPRIDELWDDCAGEYALTAIRDKQYIEWRHGAGGSSLILVEDGQRTPVAWAAYVEAPRADARSPRRARIIDVFGSIRCLPTCAKTILAILVLLKRHGFDAADFTGLHPTWRGALVLAGCRRVLLPSCFTFRPSSASPTEIATAASWHLVPADGDCGFWDLNGFAPPYSGTAYAA